MGEFDQKKVKLAKIYIDRMSNGNNPVTNMPEPPESILFDSNVKNCLLYVKEVLEDVSQNHGLIGKKYRPPKSDFPLELLEKYQYVQNQSMSGILSQIKNMEPEKNFRLPAVAEINKVLEKKGLIQKGSYLEFGIEGWQPTETGKEKGIYAEIRENERGFSHPVLMYNREGQEFIIRNFEKILKICAARKSQQ